MVSCDTNVIFAASNPDDAKHAEACAFVESHVDDPHFVIAEQTLVELYCLLRNPIVQNHPLSASEAVAVISSLIRRNSPIATPSVTLTTTLPVKPSVTRTS